VRNIVDNVTYTRDRNTQLIALPFTSPGEEVKPACWWLVQQNSSYWWQGFRPTSDKERHQPSARCD